MKKPDSPTLNFSLWPAITFNQGLRQWDEVGKNGKLLQAREINATAHRHLGEAVPTVIWRSCSFQEVTGLQWIQNGGNPPRAFLHHIKNFNCNHHICRPWINNLHAYLNYHNGNEAISESNRLLNGRKLKPTGFWSCKMSQPVVHVLYHLTCPDCTITAFLPNQNMSTNQRWFIISHKTT